MTMKHISAVAVAALLAGTAANAQMWADENEFRAGIGETGMYDAWDRDDTVGLSENEFATGVFADWDRDNDRMISEEEYGLGTERWYGVDYATPFTDWDANQDGMIDTTEFGGGWDSAYYSEWDADGDALLTEDEWNTGLYGRADANQDMVITIEEEGWFEGWFDGDDIEAEIQEVGEVMQ